MAKIVIALGSQTIPDNAVDSGKLTQQDMKDWLDEQYDTENAGTAYVARMRKAFRKIGERGVTGRVAHLKHTKARRAAGGRQGGLVEEEA